MTSDVVARDRELALVEEFMERVASGPAALMLEGEAGSGKTTIWNHGVTVARAREYRVLASSPAESERELSFAALGDLLAPVADDLGGLPEPQRRALRVALLLTEPDGSPPDQRAVAVAALTLLRRLADARPLVVAIDDVQWLDPPSARVLQFALRRLNSEAVGAVLSRRVSPGTADPLALPEVKRIRVGPLSPSDLRRLLRLRLDAHLPRGTVVRVHGASGGNPLFALELARALLESGAMPADDEPLLVPQDLGRLLGNRLRRLSGATRDALAMLAAASHPAAELMSESDVEAATDAGILEPSPGELRFTHPLFGSVVYAQTAPQRRREIHGRLAQLAKDPEQRARHLALSHDGPSEPIAAELDEAASRARARGAPDAAAELAEKAARLTPSTRGEERRRRALAAAEHHFVAGEASKARTLLEHEIAAMEPGPERARALLRLAAMRHPTVGMDAALEACERALEEPFDDLGLEAEIHTSIGFFADLDNRRRAIHARRALELLEAQPGVVPELLSSALVAHGIAEYYVGQGLDVAVFERAIELEARSERPRAAWTAGSVLGQLLKYTDDYAGARIRLEAAYRLATDQGDVSSIPDLAAHLSELELWTGAWAEADRLAREAAETAELAEQELLHAIGSYCRALVDAHLGRVDSARALAEQALRFGERRHPWVEGISLWVLGFLDLSRSDASAVDRHLSRADEIAETIGLVEPGQWRFHPDHVEALIELGELDRASSLLDRYEERGRAVGRPFALATAARCRGLLAAALGDREAAAAAFADSLREHERLHNPFERGRTLLAEGAVARRFQQRRAARGVLGEALRSFEHLGAPVWAERARSELERVGGRRASPGTLTATEQRIAELVAAGRSNQQVAAALHLAPKTVEWNLSKVYRKLNVRSRTELSAKLARRSPPVR